MLQITRAEQRVIFNAASYILPELLIWKQCRSCRDHLWIACRGAQTVWASQNPDEVAFGGFCFILCGREEFQCPLQAQNLAALFNDPKQTE